MFCTDSTATLGESTVLPASAHIGNERREAEVLLSPGATAGEVRKGEALALAAHWLDAGGLQAGLGSEVD